MSESREPEDLAVALLQLLCRHGGTLSATVAADHLKLRRSQLERLILLLGEDPYLGGLGYLAPEEDGLRLRLRLTEKGKALCPQDSQSE